MDDLGAQYRAAKRAVEDHVRRWAEASQARQRWLKAHRHVPASELFDPVTGDPLDPELLELLEAEEKEYRDSEWCRGLVIACGEAIKGRPFEELLGQDRAAAVAEVEPDAVRAAPSPEEVL